MKNRKFEYFLNAIHYSIYLEEIWSNKKIDEIVNYIFSFISIKWTKGRVFSRRYQVSRKHVDEYIYGRKTGQSIGMAHHLFGIFYSCYSGFLSWICIGVASREYGFIKGFLGILIFAIPVGLCYIPAYKAVFTNDKYLKYFKRFEKEDAHWHKKWKRNTIMFCIGGIITTIIGFFLHGSYHKYVVCAY